MGANRFVKRNELVGFFNQTSEPRVGFLYQTGQARSNQTACVRIIVSFRNQIYIHIYPSVSQTDILGALTPLSTSHSSSPANLTRVVLCARSHMQWPMGILEWAGLGKCNLRTADQHRALRAATATMFLLFII